MIISHEQRSNDLNFDDCQRLAYRVLSQLVEDATRYAAGEKSGLTESEGESAVDWFLSENKEIKSDRKFWCTIAGDRWDEKLLRERVIKAMSDGVVIRTSEYSRAL